jgi:hypothetical protein
MQVLPFTDDSGFAVQSSRSVILLTIQPNIETGRSVGNKVPCKSKSENRCSDFNGYRPARVAMRLRANEIR